MKEIWHHFKYEYKSNSKILWFVVVLMLIFMFPFANSEKTQDMFMLIYFPMMTGWALGFSTKKDFCLKYYLSLPMEKDKIILTIMVGKSIYFLPTLVLFIVYYDSLPTHQYLNLNFPLFILMFVIVQFILNLVQIFSDIEAPRIENVDSKFEGLLMFVKKNIFNYFIYGSLIFNIGFVFVFSLKHIGLEEVANQYAVVFYLTLVLYFAFQKCYKHLIEEHRTYWNWKTDGLVATILGLGIIAPAYYYIFKDPNQNIFNEGKAQAMVIQKNYEWIKKAEVSELMKANKSNVTPLATAIYNKDNKAINLLLLKGVRPQDKLFIDSDDFKIKGLNELTLSIHYSEFKITRRLLNFNSDPNIQSPTEKFYPIHIAAFECKPEIIALLVEKGADIHARNRHKRTPLHHAVTRNCYSSVPLLLSYGADASIKDKFKKTPVDYAKKSKIEFLLKERDYIFRDLNLKTRLPASKAQ